MTNSYVELLEQIILEMRATLPDDAGINDRVEYYKWLEFLKQIYPESNLLKKEKSAENSTEDNYFDGDLKCYSDIREIMMLAEVKQFPTWFVQPQFAEPIILLSYEQGMLKNIYSKHNNNLKKLKSSEIQGIPKTINGFSGKICGALSNEQTFIGYDVANNTAFPQKMDLLKSAGFSIVEFVLFPTEKIPTTPSNKLEASLHNYITQTQEHGLKVDGVVIVSDIPLFNDGSHRIRTRIIFKSRQPAF